MFYPIQNEVRTLIQLENFHNFQSDFFVENHCCFAYSVHQWGFALTLLVVIFLRQKDFHSCWFWSNKLSSLLWCKNFAIFPFEVGPEVLWWAIPRVDYVPQSIVSTRPPWTDIDHQSGCPRPSRSGLHKYHKTYNVFFQFFKVVFDIFDDCIEIACSIIFRCESWKFVNQFVDCTRCIWNAVIDNNILLHLIFLKTRFESRLLFWSTCESRTLFDPLAIFGHFTKREQKRYVPNQNWINLAGGSIERLSITWPLSQQTFLVSFFQIELKQELTGSHIRN